METLPDVFEQALAASSIPSAPILPTITLSEEQLSAITTILEWFTSTATLIRQFKLGGYAGTGKTTVIKAIVAEVNKKSHAVVCAFTGKAVNVLNKKGVRAQTIHSLIYSCETINGVLVTHLKSKYDIWADLIIVDEASMVSTDLYNDLYSFGIKLLFVGDPGQLEPIGNNPNLMGHPDIVLSKIHRQAEKSPIITLANQVRKGGAFAHPNCDELIIRKKDFKIGELLSFDQCLCARNKTRETINDQVRSAKGFTPKSLHLDEKVIVLRNNLNFTVFNGLILFIKQIVEEGEVENKRGERFPVWFCNCEDEIGIKYMKLPIWKQPIIDPLSIKKDTIIPNVCVHITYAYVITCHKSQGSEWDRLLVIDEWMPPVVWDMKRWRYTAITRAAKHLTYCK